LQFPLVQLYDISNFTLEAFSSSSRGVRLAVREVYWCLVCTE